MDSNNNCKYYGLLLTYFAIFAHCTSTKQNKKKKRRPEQLWVACVYPRYPFLSLCVHNECYICPLLSFFQIQISLSLFQGLTPLSFHTPEVVALVLPWVLQIPASNVPFRHQKLFGVECCKLVSNNRGLHWHSYTGAKALLRWFWNKECNEKKKESRLSVTMSYLKIYPYWFHSHCNVRHTLWQEQTCVVATSGPVKSQQCEINDSQQYLRNKR